MIKVIVCGLPADYDVKEIINEIQMLGFNPDHMSVRRNRHNNTNIPLFLVVQKKSPEIQDIYNITNIGYFRGKIEAFKKTSISAQCYRCQDFYHHNRFYNRTPKCLKCAAYLTNSS
ncbi:nucleic-acid-binding protein from transposon X-element [Nephila pilipes]|uniref:Nucleic-acid-binding protein from transposon X-element n=1 Tax=Nephila pilipes TaxID=299642 RepID=A0A8X6QRY4_NEPPI|nr:nucleic-acid-binding protein from transposon X-element [Nephila pilipes]